MSTRPNKIILIFLILLGTTVITDAELPRAAKYETKIKQILPSGWEISKISEEVVPYNLTLLKNEESGIAFELTGQTLVLGPRGINKEKEAFTIWIMSKEYSGTESEIQAQFYKAMLLGLNNEVSIYMKTFVSNIPTWKNWKEDLIELFGLKTL